MNKINLNITTLSPRHACRGRKYVGIITPSLQRRRNNNNNNNNLLLLGLIDGFSGWSVGWKL